MLNEAKVSTSTNDFLGKPKPEGVILVVGSSPSSVAITARNLQSLGYAIDIAHTFSGALKLLKENSLSRIPDLVLVELNFKSQLADALRFPVDVKNQTLWGRIPMILRSPMRDTKIIVQALKAGYCDYVITPADKETIKERISRVFKRNAEIEDLTYKLPISSKAIIRSEIELSALNEFGAEAVTQNYYSAGTVFNLSTDVFGKFHLEVPVRVISCEALQSGQWKYKLALGFIGITSTLQQRLRQFAITNGRHIVN